MFEYKNLTEEDSTKLREAMNNHRWSLYYGYLAIAMWISAVVLAFKNELGFSLILLTLSYIALRYGSKLHHSSHKELDEL